MKMELERIFLQLFHLLAVEHVFFLHRLWGCCNNLDRKRRCYHQAVLAPTFESCNPSHDKICLVLHAIAIHLHLEVHKCPLNLNCGWQENKNIIVTFNWSCLLKNLKRYLLQVPSSCYFVGLLIAPLQNAWVRSRPVARIWSRIGSGEKLNFFPMLK